MIKQLKVCTSQTLRTRLGTQASSGGKHSGALFIALTLTPALLLLCLLGSS
jgi:hypothetical protein